MGAAMVVGRIGFAEAGVVARVRLLPSVARRYSQAAGHAHLPMLVRPAPHASEVHGDWDRSYAHVP
jgi:hypothetical protein